MHDDNRHRRFALGLPMAMAQHLDFRLDLKQPLFRRRKKIAPRQEISGKRLRVTADERAARPKGLSEEVVLRLRFGGWKTKLRRTPARFVLGKDRRGSCIYYDVFVAVTDSL
jgi:hypothetical protein